MSQNSCQPTLIMNLRNLAASLDLAPNFAENERFASLTEWFDFQDGHTLVENHSEGVPREATGVIVGTVDPGWFMVSPSGSYHALRGSLENSKYQFIVRAPRNCPEFSTQWPVGISTLNRVCRSVATTDQMRNFLVSNGRLRFSTPIFEPKDSENPQDDDEDINSWPIESEFQEALDHIKETHRTLPLPVFDEDESPVPPQLIPEKMRRALVEVTFTLRHNKISRSENAFDNFSAEAKQIWILPRARIRPSIYEKRQKHLVHMPPLI